MLITRKFDRANARGIGTGNIKDKGKKTKMSWKNILFDDEEQMKIKENVIIV